jgi:hypothetical protein
MKILCVIGVILAFNQTSWGQVVETGPVLQTRSDDGSPIAATAQTIAAIHPPPGMILSLSVLNGYDDNVTTTQVGRSSFYTNGNAVLSYIINAPHTRLDLTSGAGLSYYYDHPGGIDFSPNVYLGLSITHKPNRRLTLTLSTLATYQRQPDLSVNLGASRQLGNFFQSTDTASVGYSWTRRFSTVTSYTLGVINYGGSQGSFENRTENTFGQQLQYGLWSNTHLVGEYRFEVINYDTTALDSTTHFVLAGIDHSFTSRAMASLRGGAEFRSLEGSGDQSSPFFESTLTYGLSHQGSLSWTTRYSIEEPDVPVASGRPTFRTGLTLHYGFTGRLSGNVAVFYVRGDNQVSGTTSSSETDLDVGPSLRYAMSRRFSMELGYHYTKVDSGLQLTSYSRNNYFASLGLTF